MGMLVDQAPQLSDVSEGEQTALMQEDDGRGHGLDLMEDVRRDENAYASLAKLTDQSDEMSAPKGVEPVEGLVQNQETGMVDHRLRDLDLLAHALGVGPDRSSRGIAEGHLLERLLRQSARLF